MARKKDKYEALKLDNQLCFPLYAASREIISLYTPILSEIGLTYTQYITFMALWEQDGMSVGDLGKRLFLDNGTLTPMLKKLEQQGYVTRSRSPEDERVVIIKLTEKGYDLREQCLDVPKKMSACVDLSLEDAAELYRLLYVLLGGKS